MNWIELAVYECMALDARIAVMERELAGLRAQAESVRAAIERAKAEARNGRKEQAK